MLTDYGRTKSINIVYNNNEFLSFLLFHTYIYYFLYFGRMELACSFTWVY